MQDVEKARAYLLQTATPGGTMSRQGAELAISRLNPTYVINLANSIQQARAEGIKAGIYSSYRPPGLGVGGFKDKYLSLHSYGLAADITGIGTAGSKTAKRWYDIATANGLHNPYGYKNRREFNHYQAVPEKGEKFVPAHPALRRSIGSLSPKSLDQMWAAAGLGGAPGALAYADTSAAGSPSVPGGPPTLRKGATDAKTGGAVSRLQQQLAAVPGGPPVAVDGKYGKQTEAAVRAVEKQYGLTQERPGKAAAGPQVQAALAGNERMRIVADTQARFGALAPGTPPGGPADFSIADAGPPGQRLQAGTGVVTIPTGTGGGVASSPGGPVSTGGFPVQNSFFREPAIDNAGLTELVTGQKMTSPHNMYNAWAEAAIASGLAHQQQTADQTRRAALEWNKDEVWPSAPLSPLFSNADYKAAAAKDDTRLGQGPAPELVRLAQEAASGGAPGGPAAAASVPARGYDTRGVSAGLSSPNVGAANALMQQVAPPVSRFGTTDYFPENVSSSNYTTGVPGRTGNAPTGINNFGDIADAWRRIGGDVAGLFGGPPTSTATPQTSVPQGFAPIPPDVPESASPSPYPFSGVTAGGRIGAPQQQSSLGGYPQYAGAGMSEADIANALQSMIEGPPVGPQDNVSDWGRPANQPATFSSAPAMGMTDDYGTGIPRDPSSSDYGALPARFNDQDHVPFRSGAKPSLYASSASDNVPYTPTSLGGDLSRLGTPGERAEDVPGVAVGGGASAAPAYSPPVTPPASVGRPYSQSNFSDRFGAGLTDASTLLPGGQYGGVPGGAQFQASGAELPAAGDEPAASVAASAPGGVPYATDPMRRTAGFTNIGNGVVQTPQPPPSLGARIAKGAATFGAGALGGPAFGMLASVIGNSLMRSGGLDNAQPYRGMTTGNYGAAAPNPYGGYTTGSSYSASPFTPAGSGWHAPSFSPVSGGNLYAYQPNGQGGGTYVDSQGRVHNY